MIRSPVSARRSPATARKKNTRADSKYRTRTERGSRSPEPLCLDTVDSAALQEELEETGFSSDENALEAVQLSQEQHHDIARERAEEVLNSNPADAAALYVTGLECESRQDWGEAARFFLVGMGKNAADQDMERGFQTNVDMIRSVRNRWVNEKTSDKWDDVLSFKPRNPKRVGMQAHKESWWRLGPLYEAILQGPDDTELGAKRAYIADLILASADPEEQRMELRRILYQQMDYLNTLYAYYQSNMTDDWPADQPLAHQVDHDGHEADLKRYPFGRGEPTTPMRLGALMRLLKDSKVIFGSAKVKLLAATVGRIHLHGRRHVARRQHLAKDFDIDDQDPHDPRNEVDFYDWIETLIRVAAGHTKVTGSLAQRFEALIEKFIRPEAMRRVVDKNLLEFASDGVQAVLREPGMSTRVRRLFEVFAGMSLAGSRAKVSGLTATSVSRTKDVTINFNQLLILMEKADYFDPNFTVKRCCETYNLVTCDGGLLPQEHPNNQSCEMDFEEFLEWNVRVARIKKGGPVTRDVILEHLDTLYTRASRSTTYL